MRTFTFFLRMASSMEAEMESVVSPHGSCVMTSFVFSRASITARTFTLPRPSWYSLTSITPPSWKSGYSVNGFFWMSAISASSRRRAGSPGTA